jgi:hypothetical protein
MFVKDLDDSFIKRDAWVKALKKAYLPDEIAALIEKRVQSPHMNGPFIRSIDGETAVDIVSNFMLKEEHYRKKIAPAVGLLLYNLLEERINVTHELLRGVFTIIKDTKLQECFLLLWKWLKKNEQALACDDIKWKTTYKHAMYAFAYVQHSGDTEIENWWMQIWNNGSSFWWGVAFIGLKVQNPVFASTQLENLIKVRRYEKTTPILTEMFADKQSRELLETAISVGIKENSGWAGYALNQLWGSLGAEERNKMMESLREKVYG